MFEDEDEPLVDAALAGDVFTFIRHCIVANADFHREVCELCRSLGCCFVKTVPVLSSKRCFFVI